MKKLLVLFVCVLLSACGQGYSEGSRAGVVTKFSNKGLINKTWEGEMNLGGMTTDGEGAVVANVWRFTVKDSNIVKQVQDAMNSGKRVELQYSQWLIHPPMQGDTDYEVVGVKYGNVPVN